MELLNQQTQAIEKLHRLKVGALFMEPGTGKTRTAYELVKSVKSDHIIWLTPFQTKQNLQDEINKCGGLDNIQIVGIETLSSSDRTYLQVFNKVKSGHTFLVVDESLKIKNWEAIRTKRILELSKFCQYKLVLNGTPITRNLLDVWAQIEFLSPKILNMSIAEFKSTFCETVKITKRINGKRKETREFIAKYHNVDYLYSLIKHYVYECDLELTIEQEYKDIEYSLGEEEMEVYNELKTKYLDSETLKFMNNNIFIEMTQKMQHGYCCTESKFKELEKLLKTVDASKVIVYTKYIVSKLELQKRYPTLQVLSYGKHSLGLNLQQYNVTVYFDKTFDYSQMTQSKFRTYRTGQKDNCTYYSMTGNVGLEKMINDNIHKKQSLLEYFKKVGIEQIKKEL
jgi:SNF2 family DNA or RNA helicase